MWGDGRDHDRELEFWWDSLAYWDDYVAGKRTFDRKGAGIAGIERDRYFHNRGAGASPLFEERAFLDGLDLETNGRAAVAFDANGDGALDVYVRSVQAPEALFFGSRRAGGALPAGAPRRDAREGQPRRRRRAHHGDASRRPPHRARDGKCERVSLDRAVRSRTSGSAARRASEPSRSAGLPDTCRSSGRDRSRRPNDHRRRGRAGSFRTPAPGRPRAGDPSVLD